MHLDKALLSVAEVLSANRDAVESVTYQLVLSLSKALLSTVEGHERVIYRGSLKPVPYHSDRAEFSNNSLSRNMNETMMIRTTATAKGSILLLRRIIML